MCAVCELRFYVFHLGWLDGGHIKEKQDLLWIIVSVISTYIQLPICVVFNFNVLY